ncbi:hypothetical protein C8R43DRAFT_604496 [Mycena crocata]|nr:hypothetical protein C8R43DRAFT_604496 [Mycena crocata]
MARLLSGPITLQPETLVAYITDALQDPANPKSCWNCLAGSFYILIHPEEVPEVFGPQTEPEFVFGKRCTIWPTIMKFVTAPRTDKELADLVVSRKHCLCSHDWDATDIVRRYAHSIMTLWYSMWKKDAPDVASSPFHSFFSRVFKHLTPYLHDQSPTSVATRRTHVWPFCPQDCIPFGPEITVKSLRQWIRLYREPQPFAVSLLGVVGHVARSLVVPTIAASPNLAAELTEMGHRVCDTATQRLLDQSLTPEQVIEIGDAFHRHMWHIEKFWKCIFGEANIQDREMRLLCGGQERALFDLSSKALELLHTPAFFSEDLLDLIPNSIWVFTDVATTMYVLGNLMFQIPPTAQNMRSDILANVLRRGKEWGHAPNEPAAVPVFMILKHSKDRNVCFSLGCTHSIQESTPEKQFRRCSGCQLVSYCGRECQVAAWRDVVLPHRDICADIKAVIKQGGGSVDSRDVWRARVKKGHVNEDLARKVLNWLNKWEAMQANHFIAN